MKGGNPKDDTPPGAGEDEEQGRGLRAVKDKKNRTAVRGACQMCVQAAAFSLLIQVKDILGPAGHIESRGTN